jgi:hypothetical protein
VYIKNSHTEGKSEEIDLCNFIRTHNTHDDDDDVDENRANGAELRREKKVISISNAHFVCAVREE